MSVLTQTVVDVAALAEKLTELANVDAAVKYVLPVQWSDAEHPEYNTFHTQSVTHWLVVHET